MHDDLIYTHCQTLYKYLIDNARPELMRDPYFRSMIEKTSECDAVVDLSQNRKGISIIQESSVHIPGHYDIYDHCECEYLKKNLYKGLDFKNKFLHLIGLYL